MKAIVIALALMMAVPCFARDITITGIPDGITDVQVKEQIASMEADYEIRKVNSIPEVEVAVNEAMVKIKAFRTANGLDEKTYPI